jgi:hypothetical protein
LRVTSLVALRHPVPSRPARGGTGQGEAGGRPGSAGASPADSPDRAEDAHYFVPDAVRLACTVCGGPERDGRHYLADTDCPHRRRGMEWSAGEHAYLNCETCYGLAVEPGLVAELSVERTAGIVGYDGPLELPEDLVRAGLFPGDDEIDEWYDADPDAADLAGRLALALYAHAGLEVDDAGQPADERLWRALFGAAFRRMCPMPAEPAP